MNGPLARSMEQRLALAENTPEPQARPCRRYSRMRFSCIVLRLLKLDQFAIQASHSLRDRDVLRPGLAPLPAGRQRRGIPPHERSLTCCVHVGVVDGNLTQLCLQTLRCNYPAPTEPADSRMICLAIAPYLALASGSAMRTPSNGLSVETCKWETLSPCFWRALTVAMASWVQMPVVKGTMSLPSPKWAPD